MACLIAGDSIAVGVSAYYRQCSVSAKVGISSFAIIARVNNSGTVVISAGSNDPQNPLLEGNLRAMRDRTKGKVIWIVPHNSRAAEIVSKVATARGDTLVRFRASRDRVHPASYRAVAQSIGAIR